MGRKLLKTVQTITTFQNPLADPDPWKPVADPLWSADPSLKTAGLAEKNALSSVSYPAGDFPTANSECRIPRIAMSIDQVTSQLTSGIAKLVLGSFDHNIFRHQNRQLNEHKYFFVTFSRITEA